MTSGTPSTIRTMSLPQFRRRKDRLRRRRRRGASSVSRWIRGVSHVGNLGSHSRSRYLSNVQFPELNRVVCFSSPVRDHLGPRCPCRCGTPGGRAVHDQHRHRRCRVRPPTRSRSCSKRGPRRCASRSTTTRRRGRFRKSPQRLDDRGLDVPLIGDFHYNGHLLLTKYPECAQRSTSTASIPATSGRKHRDANFRRMMQVAIDHDKPVRIGVNWGSLDQDLLTRAHGCQRVRPQSRATRRTSRSRPCSRARCVRRAGRGVRARARPDHCERQDLGSAGSGGMSIGGWRRIATIRSTSG